MESLALSLHTSERSECIAPVCEPQQPLPPCYWRPPLFACSARSWSLHQQHASSTRAKEETLGRCRCTYSGGFDAAAVVDVKGFDGTVQNTSPMCIHGQVKDGQVLLLHACYHPLICTANPPFSDECVLRLFGMQTAQCALIGACQADVYYKLLI